MTKLSDICAMQTEKVLFETIPAGSYVSTENMLPNKGGIIEASTAPSGQKVTAYNQGDVLISNIRPYFKKIWQADCDGGCSNDVLVFRATQCNQKFLYYVLSDDRFFDYSTKTAKGTKMPRGDKKAIINYRVPDISEETQRLVATCLTPIDKRIVLNNQINDYLAA